MPSQPDSNTPQIEDDRTPGAMTKWDYRVITINTQYEIVGDGKLENSRPSNEIIESCLEQMGADGWELVSFLPAMPTDSKFRGEYANPWIYHAVFKRPGDAIALQ